MPLTAEQLNVAIPLPEGSGIVDFAPYHLHLLDPHINRSAFGNMVESSRMGPAFTVVVNGKIGACFGLVIPWSGMAEGWMLANDAIKPIAAPFTYGARRFCDCAALSLRLRRIQIHVQISNGTFYQWAKAARFKTEATCEAYNPDGEDVFLMSRIYRR
jgi:hypothetical protein